ncbi:uncharacterized protein B0H18DRAFT_951622 [Fomitopsis serialis]|uniref:uncharacterized protein n=1 Tax=Fomitopsis serialis TaxID=139415 RepID=UPI002008CF93|nr:uncharacterized protein B0H18DRAFT_951622 [Neoantrodia serialis]KAH9934263.1 hypothetical protein B0H18DRAFT_951622 [Neoantrodia serialis]
MPRSTAARVMPKCISKLFCVSDLTVNTDGRPRFHPKQRSAVDLAAAGRSPIRTETRSAVPLEQTVSHLTAYKAASVTKKRRRGPERSDSAAKQDYIAGQVLPVGSSSSGSPSSRAVETIGLWMEKQRMLFRAEGIMFIADGLVKRINRDRLYGDASSEQQIEGLRNAKHVRLTSQCATCSTHYVARLPAWPAEHRLLALTIKRRFEPIFSCGKLRKRAHDTGSHSCHW